MCSILAREVSFHSDETSPPPVCARTHNAVDGVACGCDVQRVGVRVAAGGVYRVRSFFSLRPIFIRVSAVSSQGVLPRSGVGFALLALAGDRNLRSDGGRRAGRFAPVCICFGEGEFGEGKLLMSCWQGGWLI